RERPSRIQRTAVKSAGRSFDSRGGRVRAAASIAGERIEAVTLEVLAAHLPGDAPLLLQRVCDLEPALAELAWRDYGSTPGSSCPWARGRRSARRAGQRRGVNELKRPG